MPLTGISSLARRANELVCNPAGRIPIQSMDRIRLPLVILIRTQ